MSATEQDVLRFLAGQGSPASAGPPAADVQAFLAARTDPTEAAYARLNAQGGNALTDFLRMAGQGATLGFGDELAGLGAAMVPGGRGYGEARDASRQRVADLRLLSPGASTMASIAGATALPVGAGSALLRSGAGTGAKIAAGAGMGGLMGGLAGAGEAEGGAGERLTGAALPALLGGGIGAAFPAAAAVVPAIPRMFGSAGSRVAKALEKGTGLSRDINKALDSVDEAIKGVRTRVYGPFDEIKKIADPQVIQLLRSPELAPHANAIRRGLGQKGAPSFRELQAIRSRLRGGKFADKALHDQLDAAMQNALPELGGADAEYAAAQSTKRAILDGKKSLNMPAADVTRKLRDATPEVQNAFNTGRLFRIVEMLEETDSKAPALLRKFMDAGPSTQARLRSLFPDDQSFDEFVVILRKERSAEKIASALKTRWWLGGGGLAVGYGASRLF